MRRVLMSMLLAAVPTMLQAQFVSRTTTSPLDPSDPRLEVARSLATDILAAAPAAAADVVARHRMDPSGRDSLLAQARGLIESYGGGRYRISEFRRGPGTDVIVALNAVADNAPAAFVMRFGEAGVTGLIRPDFFFDGGGGAGGAGAAPAAAAPVPAPAFIDDATKKVLVDSLARVLERFHTAPDTGRVIGDAVRRAEREGRFRGMDTPAFTEAVTEVLRSVNGDKHLRVTSQPPAVPPGGGLPAQARLNNYGITKAEYLAGNVGYLKQTGQIFDSPEARTAVAAALTYLGNADALIIDMRGIPGGSAFMVNFLFSHFVPAGTQEVRVINRMSGTDQTRVALETVPGPRRTDVPLYVLVDGRSASAAEALPFSLQNAGRALVVGEPTAGAGRNNTFVNLGTGLWASVSFTRVSDPRTGREWEGRGVQPDLRVPSNEALEAAHAHALERLDRSR